MIVQRKEPGIDTQVMGTGGGREGLWRGMQGLVDWGVRGVGVTEEAGGGGSRRARTKQSGQGEPRRISKLRSDMQKEREIRRKCMSGVEGDAGFRSVCVGGGAKQRWCGVAIEQRLSRRVEGVGRGQEERKGSTWGVGEGEAQSEGREDGREWRLGVWGGAGHRWWVGVVEKKAGWLHDWFGLSCVLCWV